MYLNLKINLNFKCLNLKTNYLNFFEMHSMCFRPAYAPTIDATSSAAYRFGFKAMGRQSARCAPTMRPVCTHYLFQPFWGGRDGPTMRPRCADYAPTMRPPCV